tara:strand:+ start:4008 stop:5057 length:1050 start_codon:yes stop_codon:yes gene_type:complete
MSSKLHRTGGKKYKINGNTISTWTREAGLTEDQRGLIFYLHDHAATHDLGLEEVGKLLKQPGSGAAYSKDSIYQALTGRRELSQLTNLFLSIAEWKLLNEERKTIKRAPFIETNLTKKIFSILDTSRIMNTVQFIIGESHIGKTTALKEYQRLNNHGRTIYLRAPAGGGKMQTIQRLCELCHLPRTGSTGYLCDRLIDYFDDGMVLIVDEAHQFLQGRSVGTLEFLREIHDASGCGLVIAATPVWDEARKVANIKKVLEQLENRHLITSRLPSKPTLANLRDFAKAFGLPAPKDEALQLQNDTIERTSLGRWLKILAGASRIANRAQEDLNWSHVLHCHASLLKLQQIS